MERLAFDTDSAYNAFEGAIHISRYLFAKPFCSGKKVLDIACGEGYGSALLAKWGAESVVGIDISAVAVDAAKAHFSQERTRFVQGDIVQSDILANETDFDVIVSLETIEHVDDPEQFLRTLKKHLDADGILIVSCPNDHWYYKDGGDNPFHKRRYTFQEFKKFSEKVLGPAGAWSLGGFAVGFASTSSSAPYPATVKNQEWMMSAEEIGSALTLPMDDKVALVEANASYYVGVWGTRAHAPTVYCGYPVTMDLAGPLLWPEMTLLRNRVVEAEALAEVLRASSKDQQSALATLEDEKQARMLEHRQAIMRNTALMADRERLATVLHDTRTWAHDLEAQNNGLRGELGHAHERLAHADHENNGLRGELGHAHERLAHADHENNGLRGELGHVHERLAHADHEIASLRDRLAPRGFRAWRKQRFPNLSNLGKWLKGGGAKK